MRSLMVSILMLVVNILNCQNSINYVPNSGFEEFTKCPQPKKSWKVIKNWYSPTDNFEVFNSCNNGDNGVPVNGYGQQEPFEGDGYVGLKLFSSLEFTSSNYLQSELIAPLKAGLKYRISFQVSLAEKSGCSIDGIGCLISNDSKTVSGLPQIYSKYGEPLDNQDSWYEINGEFIASGGEKYISIGNFYPFTKIVQSSFGNENFGAFYYIDNVSLIEAPMEDTDNLVANGDFEMFNLCSSTNQSAINYCIGWNIPRQNQKLKENNNIKLEKGSTGVITNYNNSLLGSPDYYNQCSRDTLTPKGSPIPEPYKGNAYAGINLYSSKGKLRGCEYLQTKLIKQLEKNSIYRVRMYVMLSENSKIATNSLAVVFSEEPISKEQHEQKSSINVQPINYVNKPVLKDKKNWVLVEGEYVSNGGELFITVGDFKSKNYDDELQNIDSGNRGISYYFIDDLSVVKK